jgi:hypothetical protein
MNSEHRPRPLSAKERAVKKRMEASAELDALFLRAVNLQDEKVVCEFMEWMATVKVYSLFNLWLARLQRPGCGAIATPKRWSQLSRSIKSIATPIIILQPMGPVMVVYEVGDTYGPPLPESIFDVRGEVTRTDLDRLKKHAGAHGIQIEYSKLGMRLAGDVRPNTHGKLPTEFLIRLNEASSVSAQFATLCHELAHIYCGHCGRQQVNDWWPDRRGILGKGEKEFEAEGASHLVLSRANCKSKSAAYLAGYVRGCDMTKISMDAVIRAASRIEQQWEPASRKKQSKE